MSRWAPNPHKVVGTPHFCCLHVLEVRISSKPDGHASCSWSGAGTRQGCDYFYKCVRHHVVQAATLILTACQALIRPSLPCGDPAPVIHTCLIATHLHDWGGIDANNHFLMVSF